MIGGAIALKELIASFARVLNRDVHDQEITDDEWKAEALVCGWNAHAVEHASR